MGRSQGAEEALRRVRICVRSEGETAGLCFTLKTIELLLALKKKEKMFEHRQQNSDPIFCTKGNRTREVKWIE